MDKSMIKGIAVGGIAMVVLAAGGVTGYRTLAQPAQAEVLAVKEARQTVSTPQEKCEQVVVQRQAPVQDERRIAGTVLGGVAGGLLGSQVGGGSGKQVATVAGAAAGAYAGNQVQKNMQKNDVTSSTETRCKTVNVKSEKLVGYDVTYRLNGKQDVVRMDRDPGKTIPVRDGKLVLDAAPSGG
jgi:uncharacterized protein YcfJ